MTGSLDRRRLLTLAAIGAMGGCASFSNSPFWATLSGGGDGKQPKVPVTRAQAEAVRYASMLLWLGDGQRAFVVLGNVAAEKRLVWYTAKREPITTYGPFITRFIGLEVELLDTRYGGGWSTDLRELKIPALLRDADLRRENQGTARIRTQSTFRSVGIEEIEILERRYALTKYVEKVRVDPQTWFENEYWIEAGTGRCLKSRQLVLPTLPHVNIEILRYPTLA